MCESKEKEEIRNLKGLENQNREARTSCFPVCFCGKMEREGAYRMKQILTDYSGIYEMEAYQEPVYVDGVDNLRGMC